MKFCKKCQTETERYHGGDCKPCAKLMSKAYHDAHKEKISAYQAEYRITNREKALAYHSVYYAKNRDRFAAKGAAYYAENREKIAAYQTAYNAANREKIKAYHVAYHALHRADRAAYRASRRVERSVAMAAWRAENHKHVKAYSAAYRAKPESKALRRICQHNRTSRKVGKLSTRIADKLFKLQRGMCACGCGKKLGNDYHLDHIMPLVRGGLNEDWNIQLLTSTCNQQKHAKHPVDFMQSRGYLL
mgnify:FL=1